MRLTHAHNKMYNQSLGICGISCAAHRFSAAFESARTQHHFDEWVARMRATGRIYRRKGCARQAFRFELFYIYIYWLRLRGIWMLSKQWRIIQSHSLCLFKCETFPHHISSSSRITPQHIYIQPSHAWHKAYSIGNKQSVKFMRNYATSTTTRAFRGRLCWRRPLSIVGAAIMPVKHIDEASRNPRRNHPPGNFRC